MNHEKLESILQKIESTGVTEAPGAIMLYNKDLIYSLPSRPGFMDDPILKGFFIYYVRDRLKHAESMLKNNNLGSQRYAYEILHEVYSMSRIIDPDNLCSPLSKTLRE